MSPRALQLAASLCPYPLAGVTDQQLGDIVDAWLADEFASEAHRHIHTWTDNEGDAQ